jgi:hypothetical protein
MVTQRKEIGMDEIISWVMSFPIWIPLAIGVAVALEWAARVNEMEMEQLKAENKELREALRALIAFVDCGPCTLEVRRFWAADDQGIEIKKLVERSSAVD